MIIDTEIPELITLKEACEILKVHPNTLRSWDKKGVLPAVRIGIKKIRKYRKIDIEKFIDNRKK
jgi:excisionase family DNA binding protein